MNNMLQDPGSVADGVLAVRHCSGRPAADDRVPSPYGLSGATRLEASYPYHFSEGNSSGAQRDRSGCDASLRPTKRRRMPPPSPAPAMPQVSAAQSSTSGSDSDDALTGRNKDCSYRRTHHQPTHQLFQALPVHYGSAQHQHQQHFAQGLQQPMPNVAASIPGPVEVYVHGTTIVRGTFHPDLYLSGGDCIEWEGQLVSRSRFEKEGGSTAAKWHCSIKVAGSGSGDKQSLGVWLQERNLPVLKGVNRRSRQQRQAEACRARAFQTQPQPQNVGGCPANTPLAPAPVALTTGSGGPALILRPIAARAAASSTPHSARAPSPGAPPTPGPTATALHQHPASLGTSIAAAIAAATHPTTSHTASHPDQLYGPWHRPLSCPPPAEEPLPCMAAAGGSSLRTSSCGLPSRVVSTSISHPTDACRPTRQLQRSLQAAHPAHNTTGGSGVPPCSSSAGASRTAAAGGGGGGTTLQLMPLHLLLVKVREYATRGIALPCEGLGGQCAGLQPAAAPSGAVLAAAEPGAARPSAPAQEVASSAVAGPLARPRRGVGGGVGVRGGDGVAGAAAAEAGHGEDDSDYEPDADVDEEDEDEDEDY